MKHKRTALYDKPPDWPALMSAEIARAYLGDISRQLFHKWTRTPGFPRPLRIHGYKRWSRQDLDSWIADRASPGMLPDAP